MSTGESPVVIGSSVFPTVLSTQQQLALVLVTTVVVWCDEGKGYYCTRTDLFSLAEAG